MGICSNHRNPKIGCKLCSATPEDLFGKDVWAKAKENAIRAGKTKCSCGFTYYLTVQRCPRCGKEYSGESGGTADAADLKSEG